jgi:hypothetical protein
MNQNNKRRGNPVQRIGKQQKKEVTNSPNASPHGFQRPHVLLRKFFDEEHTLKGIIFIFINDHEFTNYLNEFPVLLNDDTKAFWNGKILILYN